MRDLFHFGLRYDRFFRRGPNDERIFVPFHFQWPATTGTGYVLPDDRTEQEAFRQVKQYERLTLGYFFAVILIQMLWGISGAWASIFHNWWYWPLYFVLLLLPIVSLHIWYWDKMRRFGEGFPRLRVRLTNGEIIDRWVQFVMILVGLVLFLIFVFVVTRI